MLSALALEAFTYLPEELDIWRSFLARIPAGWRVSALLDIENASSYSRVNAPVQEFIAAIETEADHMARERHEDRQDPECPYKLQWPAFATLTGGQMEYLILTVDDQEIYLTEAAGKVCLSPINSATVGNLEEFDRLALVVRLIREQTPSEKPVPVCSNELPCCLQRNVYNGFGSDGPTRFTCPKACRCHD